MIEQFAMPTSTLLNDGRVRLRRFRLEDAEEMYEAVRESIDELHRWLPWCHHGYSREEAQTWVETRAAAWVQGSEYSFVICDLQSERLLGGVGLNQFDPLRLRANLGYWVRTSETGRGLATSSTRLLASFGLESLGLERIEIVAAVGNRASQRVAEKAGATREGIARGRLRVHGVQLDAACFSFIPNDFGLRRRHG